MRRKIQRARPRCAGVHTTIASRTSRSSRSGSVRAAFCAVVDAVSSVTSSTAGPRQSARICSASDGPPSGDQPLNTTALGKERRARRSASLTSRRQPRLMR